LCAISLGAGEARGQILAGVLNGMSLQWVAPAAGQNEIKLTIGSGFVANFKVELTLPDDQHAAAAGAPVAIDQLNPLPPIQWLQNSIYYCYVVAQNNATDSAKFLPVNTYSLLCSFTAPNCDGTPSAAIEAPTHGAGTTSAIFVGSFMTGPKNGLNQIFIYPFYRNGEEVLVAASEAGIKDGQYDPGICQSSTPSSGPQAPGTVLHSGACILPASASAGIYDVHVAATPLAIGGTGSVFFLDPNNAVINPGPASCIMDNQCQAGFHCNIQFAWGGTCNACSATCLCYCNGPDTAGVQAQMTANGGYEEVMRLRLNFDANSKIPYGFPAGIVPGGNSITVGFVTRGYVEPINRLCSR
jgi:hypothetical protein